MISHVCLGTYQFLLILWFIVIQFIRIFLNNFLNFSATYCNRIFESLPYLLEFSIWWHCRKAYQLSLSLERATLCSTVSVSFFKSKLPSFLLYCWFGIWLVVVRRKIHYDRVGFITGMHPMQINV